MGNSDSRTSQYAVAYAPLYHNRTYEFVMPGVTKEEYLGWFDTFCPDNPQAKEEAKKILDGMKFPRYDGDDYSRKYI